MIVGILSFLRISRKVLLLGLSTMFFLTACSGSPAPGGEVIQPGQETQALEPIQMVQPADTEEPVETQAPTELQAEEPVQAKSAGSGVSACSLVTKDEAEAAIGFQVSDPVEENIPPLYGCRYKAADLNYVGISLVEFADGKQAADAFQWEIDINKYEEVSGLGDRALRPEIYDISVLKGRYELSINIVNDADEETRYEKAKELATFALSRLQ